MELKILDLGIVKVVILSDLLKLLTAGYVTIACEYLISEYFYQS